MKVVYIKGGDFCGTVSSQEGQSSLECRNCSIVTEISFKSSERITQFGLMLSPNYITDFFCSDDSSTECLDFQFLVFIFVPLSSKSREFDSVVDCFSPITKHLSPSQFFHVIVKIRIRDVNTDTSLIGHKV